MINKLIAQNNQNVKSIIDNTNYINEDINNLKEYIESMNGNIISMKENNNIIIDKIKEKINNSNVELMIKIITFQKINDYKYKETINECSNLNDVVTDLQNGLIKNLNSIQNVLNNVQYDISDIKIDVGSHLEKVNNKINKHKL